MIVTVTVQVEFPDGVKEVPAYYDSSAYRSGWGSFLPVLTPTPSAGWEFRRRVGGPCVWVAFELMR